MRPQVCGRREAAGVARKQEWICVLTQTIFDLVCKHWQIDAPRPAAKQAMLDAFNATLQQSTSSAAAARSGQRWIAETQRAPPPILRMKDFLSVAAGASSSIPKSTGSSMSISMSSQSAAEASDSLATAGMRGLDVPMSGNGGGTGCSSSSGGGTGCTARVPKDSLSFRFLGDFLQAGRVSESSLEELVRTLEVWTRESDLNSTRGLIGRVVADLVIGGADLSEEEFAAKFAAIEETAKLPWERKSLAKLYDIKKNCSDAKSFSASCLNFFLDNFVVGGPSAWHNSSSDWNNRCGSDQILSWCGLKVRVQRVSDRSFTADFVDMNGLANVLAEADQRIGLFSPCFHSQKPVELFYNESFLRNHSGRIASNWDHQHTRTAAETDWLVKISDFYQTLLLSRNGNGGAGGQQTIASSAPQAMQQLFRYAAVHPANLLRATIRSKMEELTDRSAAAVAAAADDDNDDDYHHRMDRDCILVPAKELARALIYFESVNSLLFPDSPLRQSQFRHVFLRSAVKDLAECSSKLLSRLPISNLKLELRQSQIQSLENCLRSPLNILKPAILTPQLKQSLSLLANHFLNPQQQF